MLMACNHLFVLRDSVILILRVRQKSAGGHGYARAEYWREYYTRKQREWRAANPRIRTGRKRRNKKPPYGEA
jgi:hypothetical protein